jgi:spermidine synthase
VSARFEVLDTCRTGMGELMLRRRLDPISGADLFEVKLGDEFLMSSLFTAAEVAVARLALDVLSGAELNVAVGGLGLGYTAQTVLDDTRVSSLVVVEALDPVIDWHERGLVPVSVSSNSDVRCRLVHGDFFAMMRGSGLDPDVPDRRFHAIVVDIDHSPRHLLHASHGWFYESEGAQRVADRLHHGGVFTLWSNDPPDEEYVAVLGKTFHSVEATVVTFANPLQDRDATNTVYVARKAPAA